MGIKSKSIARKDKGLATMMFWITPQKDVNQTPSLGGDLRATEHRRAAGMPDSREPGSKPGSVPPGGDVGGGLDHVSAPAVPYI